ncbi:ATP-dependent RNA helicase DEAH13 [Linum grandiflorum]
MKTEEDSNALIMPARKNKRKSQNKENEAAKRAKTVKLSKSQKRKLKKLEEEKGRAGMLLESVKILEKYKLPEEAFALLRSSKDICRAETAKEKRRMAVQFSKAGLEGLLHTSQPFKTVDEHPASDSETESTEVLSSHGINKGLGEVPKFNESVSLGSHQQTVNGNKLHTDVVPVREVSEEKDAEMDDQKPVLGNARDYSPSKHDGAVGESLKLMNKSEGSSTLPLASSSKFHDCSMQRPHITPTVVHVKRPEEVETTRKDLPIIMMEQEIMEAINENLTVIICGETGCGKTTQVPQFLYEAGFGSKKSAVHGGVIGVTQPRRVAVLATARRVAFELGVRLGKEVGFQVRHDKRIGDSSAIKFMTDGILLREVQNDFLLRRYSVLVLDEAHERSVNTDILIGMLSRVIQLRQKKYQDQQQMMLSGQKISPENMVFPLKLVLMSATMRVEDFISGKRLFRNPPPVVEVPTRQFPVSVHFSKRTEEVDYIGQAFKKVKAIHQKLPQGGILVFVTGQREVEYLCQKFNTELTRKLKKTEERGKNEPTDIGGINIKDINEAFDFPEDQAEDQSEFNSSYNAADDYSGDDSESESDLEVDDDSVMDSLREEDSLVSLKAAFDALAGKTPSDSNPEGLQNVSTTGDSTKEPHNRKCSSPGPVRVLPLYAMLPAAAQLRIFEEMKEGERLIVVATNVAETSLTIPGIKYVVDTGREKVKTYNPSNGMESYEVQWISKASAAQRAGRAGRTGPGHCYRLYTAAAFGKLPDFSCAEISKVPVDSIVLVLKSMNIDKVQNFPFPTPPETTALLEAERCLKTLEALENNGRLTSLGKAMACYPMSPRHSRMLLTVINTMRKVKNYDRANLVLAHAVAAAAALSVSNPFQFQFGTDQVNSSGTDQDSKSDGNMSKEEKRRKKQLKETGKASRAKFSNPSSDALTVAYALKSFELSETPVEFCREYLLHFKTMEEMSKLRKQLQHLVFSQSGSFASDHEFAWVHGSSEQVELAWRTPSNKNPLLLNEEEFLGEAICAGWADRVAKRIRRSNSQPSDGDWKVSAPRYQACMVEETVFLHRYSSLASSSPEFLVYSELLHTKRPYMHGSTSVKPEWLVKHAKSMCSFSTVDDPKPYYDAQTDQVFNWVSPTFGPHLWKLPLQAVPISNETDRVKVFACALLEGHVLPCLRSVRKMMIARPSTILEKEATGDRRVGNLVFKMKARRIDGCKRLREVWKEDPVELQGEVMAWFNKSFHYQFEQLWSQMLAEIELESQDRPAFVLLCTFEPATCLDRVNEGDCDCGGVSCSKKNKRMAGVKRKKPAGDKRIKKGKSNKKSTKSDSHPISNKEYWSDDDLNEIVEYGNDLESVAVDEERNLGVDALSAVEDSLQRSSFHLHLENELSQDEVENLSKKKWKYSWEVPYFDSSNYKWMGTGECCLKTQEMDTSTIGVKQSLYKHWLDVCKVSGDFSASKQSAFFSIFNSYKDVLHCNKKPFYLKGQGEDSCIMDAYLMHTLNHVFKSRDLVKKNDSKVAKLQESSESDFLIDDAVRDRGFTRPKVLIILPIRHIALRVVKRLIQLTPPAYKANVEYMDRFLEKFGSQDDQAPLDEEELKIIQHVKSKKPQKPSDYEALFGGNSDDDFMVGIKFTRKSIKLFSDFYSSDVIVASPLALWAKIDKVWAKTEEDFDYLSAIEVSIVDHADVIAMQNWDHLAVVLEQSNRMPSKQHGTDIMRIRKWHLDGQSKFYRQTVMLGHYVNPDMNASFSNLCCNYQGKIKSVCETHKGVLHKVLPELRQIYERVEVESVADADDARLDHFIKKVFPKIKDSEEGGIMIFISSYFEFVRVRNFLFSQKASFCLLGDNTQPKDVSRARNFFLTGKHKIILYTERLLFFRRYKIRGVKELIMYSLPERKEFYPEVVNMLEGANNMSCTVLFSKLDWLRLERIVGTASAKRMVTSEKPVFVLC